MKLRLPSVSSLADNALQTLQRFPLVLLAAAAGTVAVLQIIELPYELNETHMPGLIHALMTSVLGLSLFLSLALFSEYRNHSNFTKYLLQFAAFALLLLYYYLLPQEMEFKDGLRFAMYCLAVHLMVSFLPFAGKYQPEAFWEYNKTLFLRILLAALYTVVLWAGLSIALLAIDQLFNADISEKWYGRLFVVLAGLFNTWFFLAGVPLPVHGDSGIDTYPKGLKIFTQFVLLPLITIYLVILYAYIFKIIFTQAWPVGWVSWLVLSFSVAGILSLLLIWPVRNNKENNWIRVYSRGFYIALFPLVLLLWFAIKIRINAYGITEGRYYVLLLAFWLAGIAAYFLFSRLKSIKVIPVSLFVLAILSLHGPWSAFSISTNSQVKRFLGYLEKNNMLKDGKIIAANDTLSQEDTDEISAKVFYLNEHAGYQVFQPYFVQDLDSLMKPDSTDSWVNEDDRLLGLMNVNYYTPYKEETYFYYRLGTNAPLDISGYDEMVEYSNFYSEEPVKINYGDSLQVMSFFSKPTNRMVVYLDGDSVFFNVEEMIFQIKKSEYHGKNEVPQELISISKTLNDQKIKVIFREVGGHFEENRLKLNTAESVILFTRNRKETVSP